MDVLCKRSLDKLRRIKQSEYIFGEIENILPNIPGPLGLKKIKLNRKNIIIKTYFVVVTEHHEVNLDITRHFFNYLIFANTVSSA